jgi:hypothetical protein
VTVILCDFGGEGLAVAQPGDLAGYQQYPLPLDGDSRGTGPIHSEVPTLAPPGGRGSGEEGGRASEAGGAGRAGAGLRYLALVTLLLVAAGAVYYWSGVADGRAHSRESAPSAVEELPAAELSAPPRVEVVVRSDVEGGELFVDGESYGKADGGRWVLDLAPGPHKLEARAGGSSVTSSVVTVREGVPATVVLSMPEGAGTIGADAAAKAPAEPSQGTEDEEGLSERELRRRKRRAARDAAGAEKPETAPPSTTPPAATP